MANVTVITSLATDEAQLIAVMVLTGWAHVITEWTSAEINTDPTRLEGADVLWVSNIVNGSGTAESETLVGHILDLFTGTGHGAPETPGVIVGAPATSGYASGATATNSVAVELGILSAETRSVTAREGANVPQQMVTLADSWPDFPVTHGFGPDILDEETDLQAGADTTYGVMTTEAGIPRHYTHVPNESNPVAGNVIFRMYRDKQNQDAQGNLKGLGVKIGAAVRSGAGLTGKRPTATAESNFVWLGFWGNTLSTSEPSGFSMQVAHSAIEWAEGNISETFPTSGNQRSLLFGIDMDGLGLYQASSVDWTATTPAGTTILVETTTIEAAVVGAFATTINGGAINGLTAPTEDLTNKQALIRITFSTTNSANTPELTDLKITIRGDVATVTATPTDYFKAGHLTWTSGENEGLAQEIKEYDPTMQRLTFNLPARKPIAVCDEFELLPGCLKREDEDCKVKFDNVVNFRGFHTLPGKDRLLDYPDAN